MYFFIFYDPVHAQDDTYSEFVDKATSKLYEHLYKNQDSTYYYFDRLIHIAEQHSKLVDLIDTRISINWIAAQDYNLAKIHDNNRKLDSIFKVYKDSLESLPNYSYLTNSFTITKGVYHYLTTDYQTASQCFEEVVKEVENLPDSLLSSKQSNLLTTSYSYLAKMDVDEAKYDQAKKVYEKNIRFIKRVRPEDLQALNDNYILLGEVYKNLKDYEKSNRFFLKPIDFYSQMVGHETSVVSSAQNIVYNYLNQSMVDSAQYYLKLMRKSLPENHPFLARYYKAKAKYHEYNKEYEQALESLQITLNITKQKWNNRKHEEIALCYDELGSLHFSNNIPEKALLSYDKGIEELESTTKNKVTFLKLLKNKAKVLEEKAPKKAISTVERGSEALDDLKPTFKSHADKLLLIENAFPLFESGLEACYNLYSTNANDSLIDKAFHYAEKSKAVLLLEAILSTQATKFANIPPDLLAQESQLKSEITFFEKQLNQTVEQDLEKEDQLFALQEEHRQLIDEIETNYRTYYDLKYNNKTLSLTETQKLLKSDEKLISYFYGNEAIYAIGMDKTSKHIERIPLSSSLENQIKDVQQLLSDPKSDIAVLGRTSNQLYKLLVDPFMKSDKKKKLILITDGFLNYIPFGALNTKENSLSYLMESHIISYVNSATLFAQLKGRKIKDGKLLAFAPEFSGEQVQVNPSRDNLLPLPHNKREVEQILHSFSGESYINKNASLENFTSQLSNYGLLHLATHAVFDDTAPEYSYLAFSTIPNQENLLYVRDLYNLQINADLVTLSACESGVGELKKGEGFLSLARGFFYSGASSIASTLWKINDASTTTLMDSFYKNLSAGDAKDLAIQKAKKTFLETNRQNGLSHPYYWSGFIISGNTEPLSSPNYWVWIGLGILLSAAAGYLVFGKKEV